MRTFKYDNGETGVEYETLDELLQISDIWITEYDGKYYVGVPPHPDSTIYEVDKTTHKVSYYPHGHVGYLLRFYDKAKPVNPETLRKELL